MPIPCNNCRFHITINHSIGSYNYCHQCKVDNFNNFSKFNKKYPFPILVDDRITYTDKVLKRKFLFGFWPFCLKKYEFSRVSIITLIISLLSIIITISIKRNESKLIYTNGILLKDKSVIIDTLFLKNEIIKYSNHKTDTLKKLYLNESIDSN